MVPNADVRLRTTWLRRQRRCLIEARLNRALGEDGGTAVEMLAADKGYFGIVEIWLLDGVGIETAIGDLHPHRRSDRLSESERAALEAAPRTAISEGRGASPRRRTELVERSFQHVLDCGGARCTTLRGRVEIRKRYLIQTARANSSLPMRHLIAVGAPKRAVAARQKLCGRQIEAIMGSARSLCGLIGVVEAQSGHPGRAQRLISPGHSRAGSGR